MIKTMPATKPNENNILQLAHDQGSIYDQKVV